MFTFIYFQSRINEKCDVDTKLNEDCNATRCCRLVGKVSFGPLSDDDRCLLCLGTKCNFVEEDVICYHHEKISIS